MAKKQEIVLRNGDKIILTERELLFCEYYLGDENRNATQAAIRAGYSETTARNIANQNLAKLHIQKVIQDRTAPILEALGATQERILREWVELAFSRPQDGLNKDSPLPVGYQDSHTFKKLTMGEMEVDSHEKTVTFNYSPKIKALTAISEHMGLIKKGQKESEQPPQVNIQNQQVNQYLIGK